MKQQLRYRKAEQLGECYGRGLYKLETDGYHATIDSDGYVEYSLDGDRWFTFWDEEAEPSKVEEQHEFSDMLARLFDEALGVR